MDITDPPYELDRARAEIASLRAEITGLRNLLMGFQAKHDEIVRDHSDWIKSLQYEASQDAALIAPLESEIASLRAQNELTHTSYVEENNRLMAEREALRAELAEAQGSAKLNGLMCDLGFANLDTWRDETLRLRTELAAAKRELNDAEEARNDAETRLLDSLSTGQDAEEIARFWPALECLVAKLTAVEADESFQGIWGLLHAHGYQYSGPDWRDDLAIARAALACRTARNRPLPETRCDCCDNGLDDAWEFCPFCGQQHPDAAGALARRNHMVLDEIEAERKRQIEVGYSADHDDKHKHGEIAKAAASYAVASITRGMSGPLWPWAVRWFNPRDARNNLVRSAALIVAEIERLDRLACRPQEEKS